MPDRRSFCIDTALSPDETRARLRCATSAETAIARHDKDSRRVSVLPFAGSVGDVSFQMQAVNPVSGGTAGQPVIEGQIWAHEAGTRLIGNIRPQPGARVNSRVGFLLLLPLLIASLEIQHERRRRGIFFQRAALPSDIPGFVAVAVFLACLVALWWIPRSAPRAARRALAKLVDGVVIS